MKQFAFSKIKEFREAAGLTQWQLAQRIGVMVQQIGAWENNSDEKTMTVANLTKIANALKRKTDDFFV
jgi:DNA-binding XRE family transcriptional regulator